MPKPSHKSNPDRAYDPYKMIAITPEAYALVQQWKTDCDSTFVMFMDRLIKTFGEQLRNQMKAELL